MIVLPNEFIDFIQQHGITPPRGARAHDKPTRFDVKNGKIDGGASGWLVLFSDEQGGVIGDWASGLEANWQSQKINTMTQAEREAMLRERAKKQAEQEAKDKADHEQAQILAIAEYKKALTVDGLDIKYLLRKYVSNFSAKIDYNQALMLPLRDLSTGDIVSYQRISTTEEAGSQKRFASGVKLARLNAYGLIVDSYDLTKQTRLSDLQGHDVVYVVEGVATGCTVWEAMQSPVICAFSASNMQSVARSIRAESPEIKIVLCADNDTSGTGISKAKQAGQAVGGVVVIASGINGSDFNDDFVNALGGNEQNRGEALATVKASILAQLDTAQAIAPNDDNENAPLITGKPNLAIMGGLDAPIQLLAVCETESASQLASQLLKRIYLEPNATMLHLKAQIKSTPITIKKVETLAPVIWLAFGDSKAWLDQANSLGMMTLNDSQLVNVAHKQGVKAVASGINEALRLALSGKHSAIPTVTNEPIFPDIRNQYISVTIENWKALLEWEGVKLRYNLMGREVDFRASWFNGKYGQQDIKRNSDMAKLKSAGNRCGLGGGQDLAGFIVDIAGESSYHPVKDWIDRTEWDGVDRMEAFCNTLTTDKDAIDDRLKAILLTKWMLGAVMAVYADKPEAQHGVIVLQGAQGLGKTRWIKALCPIDDAVKDGLKIDASKVDSIRQVTRHWITELGELDGTFKKSEIADLKAFLTQQSDSYRLPYFITMEDYPRRTAFIASVNESQYLIDDTGNRRFWTIPVTAINHTHDLNMQQVWAQVKAMYEAGGKWYLLDSELAQLNDHNRDYEASNPYQDAIGAGFFFDQVERYNNAMTAGQIAVHCGYLAPTKATSNHFAKALRAMGFIDKLQKIKGVTGRYFIMPECR